MVKNRKKHRQNSLAHSEVVRLSTLFLTSFFVSSFYVFLLFYFPVSLALSLEYSVSSLFFLAFKLFLFLVFFLFFSFFFLFFMRFAEISHACVTFPLSLLLTSAFFLSFLSFPFFSILFFFLSLCLLLFSLSPSFLANSIRLMESVPSSPSALWARIEKNTE